MIKTFTRDDVIRYVYNETSEKETKEIENALLCDVRLQNMHKEVISLKKQLDGTFKQPSDKVRQNILNYSKSLNLHSKWNWNVKKREI